jgi:heme-degrading monooxygenase HmoA
MFSVLFEVHPHAEQWQAYLDNAAMLRPELVEIDGFVDNIRYKSLTSEGWILSLSSWRDEKAVVRWRTKMKHHAVQQKGRDAILSDYHLRVGQIIQDTQIPEGYTLEEQRLDETQVGAGTTVSLVTAKRPAKFSETNNPADCAQFLGLDPRASGLLDWQVFDAVLTPGDLILMLTWQAKESAIVFEGEYTLPEGARLRHVRVIRDYGMFDRREAPQYYPDATGRATVHE